MIVRVTFFISIITISILSLGSFLVTRAYFSDTAASENILFTTAQAFNNDNSTQEDNQNPPETPDSTPSGKIVINEVFQHSADGQEWIELFNFGGSSIDISGWRIADQNTLSESGKDKFSQISPLESGKYVVIVPNNGDTSNVPDSAVIVRLSDNTIGSGLNGNTENVYLIDSEGEVVDQIGYGNNNLFGGNSPSAPASTQSVQRIPNGEDTDQASDWKVGTPSIGVVNQ